MVLLFQQRNLCFLSEVMGHVQEDCGRKSNFNYPVLGGGLFDIEKQQHLLSLKKEFHERSCPGTVLCGRA